MARDPEKDSHTEVETIMMQLCDKRTQEIAKENARF